MIWLLIIPASYLIFSLSAVWYNRSLKKQGFTGLKYKECFDPRKHLSILLGFLFSVLIPKHVFDQYALRFYDDQCRKCIETGVCTLNGEKGCGCDPWKKALSPFETCSFHNYGPIIFNKKKAIDFLLNVTKFEIKKVRKDANQEK